MDFQGSLSRPNPRETTNPLSKLFFWWMIPLFRKGGRRNLVLKDVYSVLQEDAAGELGESLSKAWETEITISRKKQKRPHFYRALLAVFGRQFFTTGIFFAINEWIIRVSQVLFLKWLLESFSVDKLEDPEIIFKQYLYAGGICLTALLSLLVLHPSFFWVQHIGMKIRISSCSLIYRKVLKLSESTKQQASIGHLVNLCSNNVERFDYCLVMFHYYYIGPIQGAIFTYFLWEEFGVSCLAGTGFVLLLMPIQYYIGRSFAVHGAKIAVETDKRGSIMNEIIIAIRVIKMYGWEKPFSQLIEQARRMEVKILRKSAYLRAFDLSLFISTAKMISFLTFLTYIFIDENHALTSEKVFFAVAAYNVMRQVMISYVPTAVAETAEVIVSMNRIEKFLLLEEKRDSPHMRHVHSGSLSDCESEQSSTVNLEGACGSWTGDKLTLENLSIKLSGNQLVIVCGGVGSGKTSLLNALMGELPITNGTCRVQGTIAYAAQEPWIFSGNVRQNILFGLAYDEERYNEIIQVCALEDDLRQFPFGDQTLVGARGVSLSGGQKARVNLARALYQHADIYLLDDPLSAVDSRVSRHIFEKCIKTHLNGSLRILVTHQLQYLPMADLILVFSDGKISESGTYSELLAKGVDFVKLLSAETNDAQIDRKKSSVLHTENVSLLSSKEAKRIDEQEPEKEAEESAIGSVTWKLYWDYFRSANSPVGFGILTFCFVCTQAFFSSSELWLSSWTTEEEGRFENGGSESDSFGREVYISVYSAILILIFILGTGTAIHFFHFSMEISINIHNKMFASIVRAPSKFFDHNAAGRILNRFTKDLGSMDDRLPVAFYDVISIYFLVGGAMIVVVFANYYMILPTMIIVISFWVMQRFYIPTSTNVKRIEAVARSPLFTHLAATVEGLVTVRASKAEKILINQFDAQQDLHSGAWYIFIAANRWFAIWLEMISVIFLVAVTLIFLLFGNTVSGSLGLAISSVLSLSGTLQWGMRQSAETENLMTSVERALEYSKLESEAELESKPGLRPPTEWPTQGQIEFRNLSLAYSNNVKPALLNLTFSIQGREKVGIVGRTGAGKSSIISALFRLTEPTGHMFIDNIHINRIGLHDLRRKISIIPQDPALFSGTVRYNLDPFNEFSDDELWEVIAEVDLGHKILSLDFKISDGGANFSVGQRQLICLARAILRKNCIIVMDEATANVDQRTDNLIQQTIRKKFSDCTIITIAHRLHSVIDCDRILILDQGTLIEYDNPHILLQNPVGLFTSMVRHMGDGRKAILNAVAAE